MLFSLWIKIAIMKGYGMFIIRHHDTSWRNLTHCTIIGDFYFPLSFNICLLAFFSSSQEWFQRPESTSIINRMHIIHVRYEIKDITSCKSTFIAVVTVSINFNLRVYESLYMNINFISHLSSVCSLNLKVWITSSLKVWITRPDERASISELDTAAN